jgi:hypothetical protein
LTRRKWPEFANSLYYKELKKFNVPAVYDVLAARIRALRSKDQGRQNVGGVSRVNEAVGRLS